MPPFLQENKMHLTKERLDREWDRIKVVPQAHWDHTRLLFSHWAARIKNVLHPYGTDKYNASFGKVA